MKKRLIPKKYIKKAYSLDTQQQNIDIKNESSIEDIDKLPKEMFQILGEIVSFIENTDKFEGDKNEN